MSYLLSRFNQMSTLSKSCFGLGACLAVIAWEHVGRKNQSEKKPSVIIRWFADMSAKGFKKLGIEVARFSSFYNIIDIKDVGETVSAVTSPTVALILSPFSCLIGYFDQAQKYKHFTLVLIGSGTIVTMLLFGNRYLNINNLYWTKFSNIGPQKACAI
jgi:hypothetical protein